MTSLVTVQARSSNVIFYFSFSDIFKTGKWTSSWTTFDSDLLPLAKQLPDICLSAKAPNTRKKYEYAYNNFRKWCISHNVPFAPASDFHVALYLTHIRNLGKASRSVDEAFYAISWPHRLAGMSDPCSSDLVKSVREGCSRIIGRKTCNKMLPIAPDILRKLCAVFGNQSCKLPDICICCMCLLSFAGF